MQIKLSYVVVVVAYIAHNIIDITHPNLTKKTNQIVCHSFNFFNQYNRSSFSHRPYPQCENQSAVCRGQLKEMMYCAITSGSLVRPVTWVNINLSAEQCFCFIPLAGLLCDHHLSMTI